MHGETVKKAFEELESTCSAAC